MSPARIPPKIDPTRAARDEVLRLHPYIPGKPIEEVREEFGLQEVIKLASNESPLPPSEEVIREIHRAARRMNRYPDGQCRPLRHRLAQRLGIPPEAILFGNGAEECIRIIAQTFIDPGEGAMIFPPTFDAYETATRLAGGRVIHVPLRHFRVDLKEALRTVDPRTKVIWICSPNNPTGTLVKKAELDAFLQELPEDRIVVLDEAYREFVTVSEAADSRDYLLKDGRVIGIRTFSKAFGLAGVRVGYLLAHPALVELMAKVKLPFNVSVPAQAAALRALEEEGFVEEHVRRIVAGREFLRGELESRGLNAVPSQANFLFVEVPLDGEELFRRLLPRGVVVRPGRIFGAPRFIRVTVGTEEQNRRFLAALDEVLKNP